MKNRKIEKDVLLLIKKIVSFDKNRNFSTDLPLCSAFLHQPKRPTKSNNNSQKI